MKKIHLICNAHIDPVWQWTWDEGVSAAIATFKSACDLADEYDYVFCHGESLLYEVIENNAPDLFLRVKKLVKEGKWHISGGWYIQPDCLMPSGETFFRHIEIGKEYFKEKFGVEPVVATNYDSFGHSVGLVQIMAKSGYKGYMICRPENGAQLRYPSRFFRWKGSDGSSIIVSNSASYNSLLGRASEKIKNEVFLKSSKMLGASGQSDRQNETEEVDYVLWGVGNHGGGPSRKDLRDISELKIDGFEFKHSTPEDLFSDNIRVGGEFDKSLVTCMPGCYSSMARVKQAYRRTENLFYAVEKMLTAATICGMNIDLKKMREAEKQLLLSGFHDILPGTCIEEGESEGLGLLSSCERTLKEYRTQAFLYFTVDQSSAKEGEYPIFVFNFMPYAIKTPVEAEFSLADQNWEEDIRFVPYVYDEKGEKINCQQIKEESTINLDWRKRIVFEGKLNPLGITRFTVKVKPEKKKGQRTVSAGEESSAKLEIYDDTLDPWGMSKEESEAVGKNPRQFKLMTEREAGIFIGTRERTLPVRIIERGEVFDETESLYKACGTRAVIRRRVYKNQPFTDYCVTVEYADKNKLIRIKFPLPDEFRGGKVVGDGPYVWEEKPKGEFTFQKWVGVENQGRIFSVVNDCVYSGKCDGEYLYMTLLRGAGYCIHPIPDRELCPKDRYLPRIESGRYVYKFRIFEGNIADTTKIAELFNCLPYAVNVFPVGKGDKATESVVVDGDVILTSARAADGKIRLRLYNPDKRDKRFKLRVLGNEVGLQAKKGEIVSLTYENGVFINNK